GQGLLMRRPVHISTVQGMFGPLSRRHAGPYTADPRPWGAPLTGGASMSGGPYGPSQGFAAPPPVPPMPTSPPPAPPDGWRAAAVALLNISGLGLGYALLRRWALMAACWAATVVLLLVALPADADGVPS